MNILSDLLNERIVTALGWNLFHILWQGIVIGILLSLILRILKGKSSQIRYLISMISLLLILGFSIYNLSKTYYKTKSETITYNDDNKGRSNELSFIDLNETKINKSSVEIISSFKNKLKDIDTYFPLIVNIWILGVFIFIFKFVLSFFYSYRLKTINTKSISKEWHNKFLKLEVQIKLKRRVKYIESQIIKIPVVLGYLKPVVAIPFEMLSGIPSNQIEAIIAHELAHIRRNDYILNVLQAIIETVFFFHPAVWYISSHIRKERENCCDDVALSVCKDSLVYAKALVSVQEFTLNRHFSAVAFSGRKKHLLNRIKRMIMKQKVKSNFTDKIIAALIILSSVLALSFTYKASVTNDISEAEYKNELKKSAVTSLEVTKKENTTIKEAVKPKIVVKDTIRKKMHYHEEIDINDNTVTKTFRDENGNRKEMKFTLKNGKITKLLIDGNEIPESEYDQYQEEVDETIADLKDAKQDIRQAMKDVEEIDFEEIQMQITEAMSNVNINMEEIQREVKHAMKEAQDIDYAKIMKEVEMNLDVLKDMDFDFDLEIHMEEVHEQMKKAHEEMNRAKEEVMKQVDMEAIQKEMQKVQEELSKIQIEEIRIQTEEQMEKFQNRDKEKVLKEMKEKLEELESLELEEKK